MAQEGNEPTQLHSDSSEMNHTVMNLTVMNKDQQYLIDTVNTQMPFGKYAGCKLLLLPEPYLVWFHKKGFPQGKLGNQLALMYEIKLNGLEKMLKPLLKTNQP